MPVILAVFEPLMLSELDESITELVMLMEPGPVEEAVLEPVEEAVLLPLAVEDPCSTCQ